MVVLAHTHTHRHTYTNLVVEELDVLDGLMEHRCRIRLHAHREISRFSEIVHIDLRLDLQRRRKGTCLLQRRKMLDIGSTT